MSINANMEEDVASCIIHFGDVSRKSCDNLLLYHFQSSYTAEKYGWG